MKEQEAQMEQIMAKKKARPNRDLWDVDGGKLPWWSVFFAYFLATLCYLVALTLTFLYSLEWGGETSLDWLLSLFFSTSMGTFVLEPTKIVLLYALLSYVFNKMAVSELRVVAPYDPDVPLPVPVPPCPQACAEPSADPGEWRERRLGCAHALSQIGRTGGASARGTCFSRMPGGHRNVGVWRNTVI